MSRDKEGTHEKHTSYIKKINVQLKKLKKTFKNSQFLDFKRTLSINSRRQSLINLRNKNSGNSKFTDYLFITTTPLYDISDLLADFSHVDEEYEK